MNFLTKLLTDFDLKKQNLKKFLNSFVMFFFYYDRKSIKVLHKSKKSNDIVCRVHVMIEHVVMLTWSLSLNPGSVSRM